MKGEFSGKPETQWDGDRDMIILHNFSYTDKKGKVWAAPQGSRINGASIPRPLWSLVGSPYTGKYRRASIVHDVAVGEDSPKKPSKKQRRKADRMFYRACRTDGCSRRFAGMLYIGVALGTFLSRLSRRRRRSDRREEPDTFWDSPEDRFAQEKFRAICETAKQCLEDGDLDGIDACIAKHLE